MLFRFTCHSLFSILGHSKSFNFNRTFKKLKNFKRKQTRRQTWNWRIHFPRKHREIRLLDHLPINLDLLPTLTIPSRPGLARTWTESPIGAWDKSPKGNRLLHAQAQVESGPRAQKARLERRLRAQKG